MSVFNGRFLPEHLRPRERRRRPRRGVIAPATLVAVTLVLLPLWTVQRVEVSGTEVVPPEVTTSLKSLVGHSVLLLDLDWVRRLAAGWPAAGAVQVRLDLPGSLVVEIFPQSVLGSMQIGAGWHGVAADGRLTGPVPTPVGPRLVGFRRPADRRAAFAVARRLTDATGAGVAEIRQVTPADYRLTLSFDGAGRAVALHVSPEATAAERAWCRSTRDHGPVSDWADLRWQNRMVVRGAEPPAAGLGVGS